MQTEHFIWCDRNFKPIEKDAKYRDVYTSKIFGHVIRIEENSAIDYIMREIRFNPIVYFSNGKSCSGRYGYPLSPHGHVDEGKVIKPIINIIKVGDYLEFPLAEGETEFNWHLDADNSFLFLSLTNNFIARKGKQNLLDNIFQTEGRVK